MRVIDKNYHDIIFNKADRWPFDSIFTSRRQRSSSFCA